MRHRSPRQRRLTGPFIPTGASPIRPQASGRVNASAGSANRAPGAAPPSTALAPAGNQAGGRGAPAPGQPFVNLWVQLAPNGTIQIVRAVDGTGPQLPAVAAPTQSMYEVLRDDATVSVGALSQDPFVERSYGPPGNETAHADRPGATVTVSVTIPNTTLSALMQSNTSIAFYRLRQGAEIQSLTLGAFTAWKQQNQLIRQTLVPASALRTSLRRYVNAQRRKR